MGKAVATKKYIGELLVEENLINRRQIEEALKIQRTEGGKVVEILIRLGHLDVETFSNFLSGRPGVASINIEHYRIAPEICSLIPREFCVEHEIFPIDKLGNLLTVGMVCPLDTKTMEELEEACGLRVKALLCGPEDIRTALEKNFLKPGERPKAITSDISSEEVESTIKLGGTVSLVQRITGLPALPQTVEKVREAKDDVDIPMREVSDTISLDPALTGKMLQIANSAAYGLSRMIDSVHSAVTLLGLEETYAIVLASAVMDLMEKSNAMDYVKYSKQSTFCAGAANILAGKRWKKRRNGIFTAGLLHDIGRFALAEVASSQYSKVDTALSGEALIAAEHRELGIAHPEAGHILAEQWKLPPEIAMAIRCHEHPQYASSQKEFVAVIALAAHMADAYIREQTQEAFETEHLEGALARLEIDAEAAAGIYADALEELT